ncbi:unnamed protein product [Tetraodon nigroviridis]|uniref:(spotted green pufferfish) hypothetical protein n=1 Tax=Tetraodon nigroviridis TaxID=99883 RepID=Q4SWM9_TETNG|nr:unnamed protein product [Tetraodon nigroviridis]
MDTMKIEQVIIGNEHLNESISMDTVKIEPVIVGSEVSSPSVEIKPDPVIIPLQSSQDESLQCFQCLITFSNSKVKERHIKKFHGDQYKQHLQQGKKRGHNPKSDAHLEVVAKKKIKEEETDDWEAYSDFTATEGCPCRLSAQGVAKARFPGRPCTARSRLRLEKRCKIGRLRWDEPECVAGRPRPVSIGLALSEDPYLLRLLGMTEKHSRQRDVGFDSSNSDEQRRRLAKGMVASPEAGAEAGSQTGQEAAMPFQCKAKDSPEKRRRKRRKSLFGHRQKSLKNDSLISLPKMKRNRIKRVFYTYVVEPIPTSVTSDGTSEQSQQSQSISASVSESGQENSSSSTPLSARSSRVIKVPKRFLDEEIIPFPKGSLSTWLKSQTKEDEKPSPSHPESSYGDGCQQLESLHFIDDQSKGTISSNLTSHVELYKNLKKLTLKVAEKKKGQPSGEGDHLFDSDDSIAHVKKRRKSKITMEETDTPGVVRKLSVVVNSEASKLPAESREEVSGPSHRIGLSGANKTMLHLLKKAKVQLIKIDQQKQLKLSQVRFSNSRLLI